jgi:hypothetical protein
MSRFQSSILRRWWDEEEESDDDDFFVVAAVLEGLKRKKRQKKFHGPLPGHHNVPRDILGGNDRIHIDYFSDRHVYNEKYFRRRFRMLKALFLRIVAAIESLDDYFRQKPDARGVLGASPIQKAVGAFRMLAYGVSADFLNDYISLGESTIIESLKHFVKVVVDIFGDEYLRAPNAQDTVRLMSMNSARGFPGMLGSIDCMHWKWDKCPTAWRWAYTGHKDGSTMILEAVAFFGFLGSLNDINVLNRSPLFQNLTSGTAPQVEYMVNDNKYTMGYYLADGIYPTWATFVKAYQSSQGNKKVHFTRAQEALRKDVERAFGVLQSRFAMVRGLARWWSKEDMWFIMQAYVILHNMIIEDERDEEDDFNCHQEGMRELTPEDYQDRDPILLEEFLRIHKEIEDRSSHEQLRNDLVEHLWAIHRST